MSKVKPRCNHRGSLYGVIKPSSTNPLNTDRVMMVRCRKCQFTTELNDFYGSLLDKIEVYHDDSRKASDIILANEQNKASEENKLYRDAVVAKLSCDCDALTSNTTAKKVVKEYREFFRK